MTNKLHGITVLLTSFVILFHAAVYDAPAYAAEPPQKSATKKGRSTSKGKNVSRKANKKKAETSADVKKQAADTQKEIKLTEQQIRENEKSVKKGLGELGKLEGDISSSQATIKKTSGQINTLTGRINTLEKGISANENELERLRSEYLKAVKRMRVARRNNSDLAFIFASENFSQALRRLRYLRQFSEWKDRQSAAIDGKTRELVSQKENLSQARAQYSETLKRQKAEEESLLRKHARQDALVAELRKNGDALKSHLSRKQAEADRLRNRIAALIAEEERRAAEERARREAERKAEEERIAREKAKQEEAERQARLLAEQSGKDNKSDKKADKAAKEAEKQKKKSKKQDKDDKKDYAEARKRTPRAQNKEGKSKNLAAANVKTAVSAGNFAGMKGNLPRPASGTFKVTSRFGRQLLPDLPDVVYDNPGIDAEVQSGASALAVYNGKVSGVYMLPGYNTVVIVNHGNYYTVYGNISSPAVKVGDQIKAGQNLGALAPDEDDRSRSSIHFEVWRNREKLNPLDWIR